MNIEKIDARDLSEAWFLCLRKTLTEGCEYKIDRGSYAGERRKELDFVVVQIKNPGTRPLTPDVPQGVPPPTSTEYIESYWLRLVVVLSFGHNTSDTPLFLYYTIVLS